MHLLLLDHEALYVILELVVSVVVDLGSLFHVSSLTPGHHVSRILLVGVFIIGELETLLDINLDILELLLLLRLEGVDLVREIRHHVDSLLDVTLVGPDDRLLHDLSSLDSDEVNLDLVVDVGNDHFVLVVDAE